MFHITATFEDTQIVATSEDGKTYNVLLIDGYTGKSAQLLMSALQVSYVLQFNLDNDGEPEGFEKMYEELEPLFVHLPTELRPIP